MLEIITDRELLEFIAPRVGLDLVGNTLGLEYCDKYGFTWWSKALPCDKCYWGPFGRSGDAFELAVAVGVFGTQEFAKQLWFVTGSNCNLEMTRRAVVNAAYAILKAKER